MTPKQKRYVLDHASDSPEQIERDTGIPAADVLAYRTRHEAPVASAPRPPRERSVHGAFTIYGGESALIRAPRREIGAHARPGAGEFDLGEYLECTGAKRVR